MTRVLPDTRRIAYDYGGLYDRRTGLTRFGSRDMTLKLADGQQRIRFRLVVPH